MATEMSDASLLESENATQDSRDTSLALYWICADQALHYSHYYAYESDVSGVADPELNCTLNSSVTTAAGAPVMTSTPKPSKGNIPVRFSASTASDGDLSDTGGSQPEGILAYEVASPDQHTRITLSKRLVGQRMKKYGKKMKFCSKTNPNFWCPDCHKHFSNVKARQSHIREGHKKEDWELQCWWCDDGRLFSTTSNCYRHMRKHHAEEYFELYCETKEWETLADLDKTRLALT